MAFTKLGISDNLRVHKRLEDSIHVKFTVAQEYSEGTKVKLSAASTVAPVAAVTDEPIGFIVATNQTNAGWEATVNMTGIAALIECYADAAIVVNAKVACSGYDSVNEIDNVVTAVATNYACGVALDAATAADDKIVVAMYKQPVLLA